MRHVLIIVLSATLGVGIIAFGISTFQAQQHRDALSADLRYRTLLLAESLKESVEPAYSSRSHDRLARLVSTFSDRERLLGVAVYDDLGVRIAASQNLPEDVILKALRQSGIGSTTPVRGAFSDVLGRSVYVLTQDLQAEERPPGVLVIVQDASYIDESVAARWQENFAGALAYLFIFALAIAALVRWAIFKPLGTLAETIRSARSGKVSGISEKGQSAFFRPLASEIGKLTQSLAQARSAASEEARMRLEKLDTPWTAERLKEFIKAHVKNRPIFVISHAEPFVHTHGGRGIEHYSPAGGVVTAISAVMEACGGMWLAYGGGNADKETADDEGKIRVPPEEPRYTLKRVWLTEEEVAGYYRSVSNEALWPLCHIAHTRPQFRKEDWELYKKANGKFAAALLEELKGVQDPIILVQDYHLALLPQMIKRARRDAQVALFWHIPWPAAEAFSICPWRKEILEGMLGADVIGFHTQLFCNNFIETVRKEIESLVDLEHFSITHDEHTSLIKSFPISIAFSSDETNVAPARRQILDDLGISTPQLILGVDRLDYTKGIRERLRGIEFLFDMYPKHRGKVTFLQIAAPTREGIERYREYYKEVLEDVNRINSKFKTNGWRPIHFEYKHYSHSQLKELYALANVCLVTSVHDGMNLVAKEYVAARADESGALVLSQFTGASRDLKWALIVNPYSAEEIAEATHHALTMPLSEQHRRMKAMRVAVRDHNIYRWAAELIKVVSQR